MPKRDIEIFDMELLEFDKNGFSFRVIVSKGTYIRSLIRDIGIRLGVYTTMEELKRTKQGNISIDESYTLDEIKNGTYKIIPIIKVISGFEIVTVNDFIKNKIKNGRILENRYKSNKIAFVDSENNVLAFYEVYEKNENYVKPIKVL